ncbi:hypothetical protein A2635_01150 [Candidatus Peribacteria bacterium RIFCSPHIGHO2_01_FULL_51_9]|nr:MAG: hypothetical protein A2635_01150 [Candidatus Peribacteria bacterium RIFCSPHIGHO2_01_FULL_51_9]
MSPSPFHGIFGSLGSKDTNSAANNASGFPHVLSPKLPLPKPISGSSHVGQVAVDIYEQENYYIIKAPIAGVRLSDLDIEVSDNVVTIRGNRRQSDDIPEDQYYLQECFWGEFSRSITLPCAIDPKKIRATFNKECILKVLVPKEERVKIVRINEG